MTSNQLENKDKRYHESLLKKTFNSVVVGILIFISFLPFWMIYGISDFFYIIIRFVIKYRKKVIYENLTFAFPEKGRVEIEKIASGFYKHFCDLFLETIKLYSLSEKQAFKRINYKGVEHLEACSAKGQSAIVLAMHHNNWEWCSSIQKLLSSHLLMIYNPIRGNHAFENFLLYAREKWGGTCIPVHKSARTVLDLNRQGKPTTLWLGADQTPPPESKFWTIFLNREAPFFSGPEKIAVHSNQPVFFHHIKKAGRGRYDVNFIPLIENPMEVEPKEIILGYVKKMEEIIRAEPEYYLWSHRRWKHKRPEGIPLTL